MLRYDVHFVDTSVDNSVDNSVQPLQLNTLDSRDLWTKALRSLAEKMTQRNFDLWIRPLVLQTIDERTVHLSAPNQYLKEWFEDNYQATLEFEVSRAAQTPLRLSVQVAPVTDEGSPIPKVRPDSVKRPPSPQEPRALPGPPAEPPELNGRYRFDTFVVGPSNQFAHAAAELVVRRPGSKYNPLFLYGGSGLGKTHLLQAIGHAAYRQNPSSRVRYVTSERFMNEFISGVRQRRQKTIDDFRSRYRTDCDILLVDDVQFLAGKSNTEQEFFHTFNALHDRGLQIVLTSDKPPSQMPELEDRLRSRFQWGLMVDVMPPELHTRQLIVRTKATQDGIPLSDDVVHFLAENIQSNVRELEGALIRLAAFSSLQGRPITVEFAEKTLLGILQRTQKQLSTERIQRTVASYFNIRVQDLKGHRRPRSIAYPRQIAMHLCRKLTDASLSEIGRRFGGKDHTTVLAADRKIDRLAQEDNETRSALEALERLLDS